MPRPFIGTDDLSALLGVSVSDTNLITAIALDYGCQAVRTYLQQTVNFVANDAEKIDGRGRQTVRLMERPVRDVHSVVVDGVTLDPSTYDLRKSLLRRIDTYFPHGFSNVVVTYDHGWDVVPDSSAGDDLTVPADIRLVALLSARRVYGAIGATEAEAGAKQSETIGSYSYSLSSSSAAAAKSASELLAPEKAVLDPYKIRKTV